MSKVSQWLRDDAEIGRMRRLSDVGRALTYTTSLDQAAQVTVQRGAALLDAGAAVLMLADAEGLLHVQATHGITEGQITRFGAPLSDELIERLQGLLGGSDDAFIAVPLVVGGRVTGLVAAGLSHVPTPADEWLLSALADQAAVALENARFGDGVRARMEDRLRASESATNAKDRALSTLAHDIRSPLSAIQSYCDILEEEIHGPINDKQRESLGRVRMAGRHLLSLFDNVMDMARLNAGVAGVSLATVRLTDAARDAVDMLTPAAGAKLQSLRLAGASDVVVVADEARVRQVLINLIGNAVKFTPQSGSVIVITSVRVVENMHWGEVRVTDTGPGVALPERAAIFEPYYRSEGAALAPGVGLGLAISKALVAQMHGQLELESEVGVGASFTIRLPLIQECAID